MLELKMKHALTLAHFKLIMERKKISNHFEDSISQHGIAHQTTVPCNPKQNGVVERMNKTIMNMVCSMLFFKNVKMMFWGDAMLCAIYLRNIIPTHALKNKTLHEIWYDCILLVRHIDIFGSIYYS